MIGRKSLRAWIVADFGHSQTLAFVENDPEESVPGWRRAEARALLARDARRQKRLDRGVIVDDGERSVTRADEDARALDDLVQDCVERHLRGDVETGSVQRQQLRILTFERLLGAADRADHHDAEDD